MQVYLTITRNSLLVRRKILIDAPELLKPHIYQLPVFGGEAERPPISRMPGMPLFVSAGGAGVGSIYGRCMVRSIV